MYIRVCPFSVRGEAPSSLCVVGHYIGHFVEEGLRAEVCVCVSGCVVSLSLDECVCMCVTGFGLGLVAL